MLRKKLVSTLDGRSLERCDNSMSTVIIDSDLSTMKGIRDHYWNFCWSFHIKGYAGIFCAALNIYAFETILGIKVPGVGQNLTSYGKSKWTFWPTQEKGKTNETFKRKSPWTKQENKQWIPIISSNQSHDDRCFKFQELVSQQAAAPYRPHDHDLFY